MEENGNFRTFLEIVKEFFFHIAFEFQGATYEEFVIVSESEASQSGNESEVLEESDEENANNTGIFH